LEIMDNKEFVIASLTGLVSYMNETDIEDIRIIADLEGFEGSSGEVELIYETQKELKEVTLDLESVRIKLVENEDETDESNGDETNTEETNMEESNS